MICTYYYYFFIFAFLGGRACCRPGGAWPTATRLGLQDLQSKWGALVFGAGIGGMVGIKDVALDVFSIRLIECRNAKGT